MRRHALRLLLLLAVPTALALALLAIGAAFALQATPLATSADAIAPADVERALRLAQAHDPRRAIPGIVRTLRLSGHELELLLNHAAVRWHRGMRSKVELLPSRLRLRSSIALPPNPCGAWLNVDAVLVEASPLPRIESLRLGRLALPPLLARSTLALVAGRYGLGAADLDDVVDVRDVRFSATQLRVAYAWGDAAPARMLALLMPPHEHERMRRYATHLADISARFDPSRSVSLSQLLTPMFEFAKARSAEGADAALENRAALLVLGMVANGIQLGTLLPERAAELKSRPLKLTLAGRHDFTQHFLVSAALAAEQGTPLADVIGLYKEFADARSGSGFSFNDMAANRAGTRFGALAVSSPDKLQARLAAGVSEHDFMPDVADLPEFLHEQEFRRRYGGPGRAEYDRVLADIEERLDATSLFR